MAIEIVDFPIKNGDFPWQNVSLPEGNAQNRSKWLQSELPNAFIFFKAIPSTKNDERTC